jgi:DNA repair protein RecO (recombination protein O)
MIVKTKALVLSSLKYQDKSLIVRCFTLSDGLKSYFVRDAFSSKKQFQKIAYFQPLSLLEIEATHKNNRGLNYFKEIKTAVPFKTLHTNLYKSTIIMFLSEVLQNAIHEEEQNENFFTFIETTLIWLDEHNNIANFHLIFMMEITKYLGFYPDLSQIENNFFEMKEGIFVHTQAVGSLTTHQTMLLKKLLQLNFSSTEKAFHVTERQILLKIIMDYFVLHLDGFKIPKSLDVLKEVFE